MIGPANFDGSAKNSTPNFSLIKNLISEYYTLLKKEEAIQEQARDPQNTLIKRLVKSKAVQAIFEKKKNRDLIIKRKKNKRIHNPFEQKVVAQNKPRKGKKTTKSLQTYELTNFDLL